MFWPPHSSAMTSCLASSVRTRSGSASPLSILFTATTIGTLAARACWIASMVCGMTPSSAATTSTTTSVARAPRAHGGKSGMTGSVEEGDDSLTGLDVIGTDVLGDAARLARRHLGAADVVQERGLAVIDVAHDGDHRRTRLELGFGLGPLQVHLDLVFLEHLGRMAELLDHQHRGVLVDRLVDGGHDTHVHEHLDHLGRLDGHLLRELRHRDGLADADFAHHRCGGHLEAVLALGRGRHQPRLGATLLLVTRADVAGDVQLLAPVAGGLVVGGGRRRGDDGGGTLAHGRGRRRRRHALAVAATALVLLALARPPRIIVAAALLGDASRVLLGAPPGLFLLDPPPVLRFQPLALAPFALGTLVLGARGFFRLALAVIDLVLLGARLLLQHVALDVVAGAAYLDVHG